MVKAPRSKGCRICVQRRIKCDQEQPTCLRCRKAGRQCPGYQIMSFVDEGPSIRELYQTNDNGKRPVDQRSLSSSATSSDSKSARAAPFDDQDQGMPGEWGVLSSWKNRGQSQDLERLALVSILSPTAYQSQLLSLFLDSILSDKPMHSRPTFDCHSIWLSQLASRAEVSASLLYAIRAMSLSFLGRQARDDNLVQNSRWIYGKALLKLNRALQDPAEGLASDTLSATVLLSFYEMLNCTEHGSWVRHAGGAARLMQLRGVARHRSDFDKAVFLACRYSIIVESFLAGKRCFLSSAPWRRLSQEFHDSSPKTGAFDDVREAYFQEIVQHPGFVTDSVDYMASGSRDRLVLQDLVRRGHMHRSNHKSTYIRFIQALREIGQEPTEAPSSVGDKVFPIVYQFPDIRVASFFCSHWSYLKILNIALIGLEAQLSAIESACRTSPRELTPAQILAARNMAVSRENLTNVIVEEYTPSLNLENTRESAQGSKVLPDRALASSPMGSRSSGSPLPAAASPTDYPTMSPSDTTRRRQLYMAENRHSAHQICKSVEDTNTAAFLGPMFLIFSLRVIGRMLESQEEKEWVVHKLELLGRTWGVAKDEANAARVQNAEQGWVLPQRFRGQGEEYGLGAVQHQAV